MDGSDVEYYDNQQLVGGSNPCKKFDDSKTATTEKNTCYRDIHIITLPEMYLVAAEAYLKAGDNPKALARLNEVHQRAGLSALTGTITIDDILDENACENFGNEARWMDLRRTQTLVTRCTKYNHEWASRSLSARMTPPGASLSCRAGSTWGSSSWWNGGSSNTRSKGPRILARKVRASPWRISLCRSTPAALQLA